MPGIPSHILLAEQAMSELNPGSDDEILRIARLHPELLRLGAIGPDLTFFAPDFGDWSVSLVRILAEFYDEAIKPAVELYEDWVKPVLDVLEQAQESAELTLDAVTCSLVSTISDNVEAVSIRASGIVQGLVLNVASESVNVFDHMTPPIQDGKAEREWFWFDTLHNRRTGRFIESMWALADTDEKRAYVLGYSCHFAGDFVGHEFVNTVVGSPARARLQRHHFAENIIDTHLFDELRSEEVTGARLHLGLPHGVEVEDAPSLLVLLDNPNEVPADLRPIFEMISAAMETTFEDAPHPERIATEYLTVENLNTAFWLMLIAMKASTSNYVAAPTFPGEDVLGAINDAMAEFMESASSPPSPSFAVPDLCANLWSEDCDFSVEALRDWIESVVEAISYLGEFLVWIADLIKDIAHLFACALTAPAKLTIHGAFWLLHEALHAILADLRECLVESALIQPEIGWVQANPLAQSLLVVSRRHVLDARSRRYPHRAAETNAGFQSYPTTLPELPATLPGGFEDGTTAIEMSTDFAPAPALLKAFAEAEDPGANREIGFDNPTIPIGSIVQMEITVMRDLINAVPLDDWSLDADRGFGYKNWRIVPGTESSVAWDSTQQVDHDWSD